MGAPSARGVHPGGGGLMLGWGHLAPGECILGVGVNAGMGAPSARGVHPGGGVGGDWGWGWGCRWGWGHLAPGECILGVGG